MLKKMFAAAAVVVALLAGSANANAQKGEITLSYGGYTQMDATNMHDGWGGVNNAWGAVNLGVNFKVAPNIWVGPSYTFSSTTTKGGEYHSNIAYNVIMFNGRYHYYSNSIVTLYAKLGVGVDLSYMQPVIGDNYTKAYFAFQAVPVGAQVDITRNFAIYGEAGFGAQGLLQVGVKYLF